MKPTLQHGRTQRVRVQSSIRTRYLLQHAIATAQIKPSVLWVPGFGSTKSPGSLLSPTKITQRCSVTGSPRAIWESFGLGRQCLRRQAVTGAVSGLRRRVW